MKKAIILAGGEGTRLRPVTLETPKPLLTVNRKAILHYLVEMFRRHGVREIAVIIRPQDREEFNWWRTRWQSHFGDIDIRFAEEPKPMGTIGYWARVLKDWTGAEPFFLTNGDELKDINLKEMAEHHKLQGGIATIALVRVKNPHEYGVAVLAGHRIAEFLEKPVRPPSNLISSGLYIIEPEAIRYLNSGQNFLMSEKDLFPRLAAEGKLIAYESSGAWYDCGNLERWEKAIREWPDVA